MKRTTLILLTAIFSLVLTNQNLNGQDCIYCNSNTVGDSSSAIGIGNTSTGMYSLASGYQNEATGDYSFAGGKESISTQKYSFAFGYKAQSEGLRSFAQGMDVWAFGGNSIAIGRFLKTYTSDAMVIGTGFGNEEDEEYLINNISGSLMIGFNSNIPTFIVCSSSGLGTTGKVGIGTSTPSEKLEVNGTFKVSDWSFMNTIDLGGSDIKNIDELKGQEGLRFKGKAATSTQMKLTEDGKLGIGTLDPDAKLQVNGDVFIDDPFSGLILKSPDGQCWKGTIDNNGAFAFESIDCNLITGENKVSETQFQTTRIFPNPAGKKLNIEIPIDVGQAYVAIYNEQGILLQNKDLQGGNNLISLKKLARGVLVVKVFDKNGKILKTEKIMHR
ncbi:MAG: T9SS type A sorting domain-containing protein [Chlorobi bacterium]|nr:T9SS type A sorting domain-containing protein [Chlorobiota bacterium]